LVMHTSYEAPHYAVFSSLPPPPPSEVQILPSAPCSQTPALTVRDQVSQQVTCRSAVSLHVHSKEMKRTKLKMT